MRSSVLFVLLALGCATPFGAEPLLSDARPAERTLIRGATIFTVIDGVPTWIEGRDVVLEDGKIGAVTSEVLEPGQMRVINAAGKTLLPGFVDAHVHLLLSGAPPWAPLSDEGVIEHNLEAHLYSGVTTVFDLGGDDRTIALKKQVREDPSFGPRIYRTGINVTGEGSHPLPLVRDLVGFPLSCLAPALIPQAKNPGQARGVLAKLTGDDDYLKITYDDMPPGEPHMDEATLVELIEGAHALGKKAVVHTTSPEDLARVAELGADLLAHGPYRAALSVAQVQRIKASGIPIVLTLTGFDVLADAVDGNYRAPEMVRATTPRGLLDGVEGEVALALNEYPTLQALGEAAKNGRATWKLSVERLVAAEVPILVGTDSALPGSYPGGSYHAELDLLLELGVPLEVVLKGATATAAAFIGDTTFGRVASGLVADLVLLDGDPRKDKNALHHIDRVFRAGVELRRRAARDSEDK